MDQKKDGKAIDRGQPVAAVFDYEEHRCQAEDETGEIEDSKGKIGRTEDVTREGVEKDGARELNFDDVLIEAHAMFGEERHVEENGAVVHCGPVHGASDDDDTEGGEPQCETER